MRVVHLIRACICTCWISPLTSAHCSSILCVLQSGRSSFMRLEQWQTSFQGDSLWYAEWILHLLSYRKVTGCVLRGFRKPEEGRFGSLALSGFRSQTVRDAKQRQQGRCTMRLEAQAIFQDTLPTLQKSRRKNVSHAKLSCLSAACPGDTYAPILEVIPPSNHLLSSNLLRHQPRQKTVPLLSAVYILFSKSGTPQFSSLVFPIQIKCIATQYAV
ncbi:uncharacterized protein LOC111812654 [Octodon degus]|uniref:Uncharacterized protein LOC111812654 n=1 Tax=Octodon degus TaxID=10160 RepID=A0A6P6DAN3_OCTDE|nr:uncharacterized protein LOC111812654 [Octodon degus]